MGTGTDGRLAALGIACVYMFGLAQPAVAQPGTGKDGLDLSGSIRARYEYLDGQFRPGFDEKDDLVSLRTTILGEFRSGGFRVGAEMYDSRAYGGEIGSAVSANDVNTLEFVQAYVGYGWRGAGGNRTAVQAGRMTINLGSRRLIANDDYRNTSTGFTGVRGDLVRGNTSATLLYLLPQQRLPDDLPSVLYNQWNFDRESFDTRLWGGLFARKLGDGVTVEGTYLRFFERDGRQATRDRRLHTFGARIIREPATRAFDYEVELIGQRGSISASTATTAARLPVGANFQHAEIGYTVAGAWKPHLSLEFDRASGDDRGRRFGRFDTLYGMRRADLGPAGIYGALGRTNIIAAGARLEVAPSKRLDAFASWRALWADEQSDSFSTTGIRDVSGASGSYAGHQFDGRVRYWVVPAKLRAELNAVYLAKGRLLRDAPNAPPTGDTVYTSLALSAVF